MMMPVADDVMRMRKEGCNVALWSFGVVIVPTIDDELGRRY